MKIFIVDDDNEVIELLKTVLQASGHEVAANVAGQEALGDISEFRPDVIITDLMMAAMDGLEFCDEVRSKKKFDKIKIVMLSARDAEHWKDKAAEHGANGYITKPINIATFAAELQEIVDGP